MDNDNVAICKAIADGLMAIDKSVFKFMLHYPSHEDKRRQKLIEIRNMIDEQLECLSGIISIEFLNEVKKK